MHRVVIGSQLLTHLFFRLNQLIEVLKTKHFETQDFKNTLATEENPLAVFFCWPKNISDEEHLDDS